MELLSVEGVDDPEGDFIKKVRDLIGTKTLFQLLWIFTVMSQSA